EVLEREQRDQRGRDAVRDRERQVGEEPEVARRRAKHYRSLDVDRHGPRPPVAVSNAGKRGIKNRFFWQERRRTSAPGASRIARASRKGPRPPSAARGVPHRRSTRPGDIPGRRHPALRASGPPRRRTDTPRSRSGAGCSSRRAPTGWRRPSVGGCGRARGKCRGRGPAPNFREGGPHRPRCSPHPARAPASSDGAPQGASWAARAGRRTSSYPRRRSPRTSRRTASPAASRRPRCEARAEACRGRGTRPAADVVRPATSARPGILPKGGESPMWRDVFAPPPPEISACPRPQARPNIKRPGEPSSPQDFSAEARTDTVPRIVRDVASVAGVSVGQAETPDGRSGVTVVRFDSAVPTVVDVRGGASATYDTASLSLDSTFGRRWAVFFSGGSLFGLDAARGIRTRILETRGGHSAFRNPNRVV